MNDQPIEPNARRKLEPGDVIQISRSQLIQFTFCEAPVAPGPDPDLLAVVRMFNAYLNEQELLEHLLEVAVKRLGAERGFVIPGAAMESGADAPLASWPRDKEEPSSLADLGVHEEPLRAALENLQPVARTLWEPEAEPSRPRCRPVLVIPVTLRETERRPSGKRTALQAERLLCALYLESSSPGSGLALSDQQMVQVLVDHVALSLESRRRAVMESEVRAAAEIQRQILPSDFRRWTHFEFHARNIPATDASGDFFEFIELSAHRLGIAVGDVSGHFRRRCS